MHENAPSTSFSMLVCMGVVSMFVACGLSVCWFAWGLPACLLHMLVAWGLSVCWLHGGCQYSMMDVVDVHVV